MLDKATMNKQKFIYYVYDTDNTIHIEKFSIIYINSEFVYFKTGRKNALECIRTNRVKDNLESIFSNDYRYIYREDRYFWNTAENPKELVTMLKKKADERRIEKNKSWAEKDLEKAKRELEEAQKRYDIWKEASDKKRS